MDQPSEIDESEILDAIQELIRMMSNIEHSIRVLHDDLESIKRRMRLPAGSA